MTEMQTMIRTHVLVNGTSYFLAQGQDVAAFKHRIEEAARSGGTFVDFIVVGNRAVSVLISSGSQVVISTETVQFDARDTGDEAAPFGGFYDF